MFLRSRLIRSCRVFLEKLLTASLVSTCCGRWPKNKVLKMVGLSWRAILLDGAQPIALGPLTRGLKWSREQVETVAVS